MDYREFVDQVAKDIKDGLGDELQSVNVTARQVEKLQGESYYGISVQPEGSNIGVTMNLKAAFDRYQDGASYDEALQMVGDAVEDGMFNRPDVRMNDLMDYDVMKEKLMVQVVPTKGNEEVLADIMGIEPEMMPAPDEAGMFVATCNNGVNGAGCIFYPEFMDQAAEKLQGDFFVLPSSVHEVILLPDNGQMDFHELEAMVRQINETEVAPQDRLSDSVYHLILRIRSSRKQSASMSVCRRRRLRRSVRRRSSL